MKVPNAEKTDEWTLFLFSYKNEKSGDLLARTAASGYLAFCIFLVKKINLICISNDVVETKNSKYINILFIAMQNFKGR